MKNGIKLLEVALAITSACQAVPVAVAVYIAIHIQLWGGYFNNNAAPFQDNPISYVVVAIILGMLNIVMLLVYIVMVKLRKQKLYKRLITFVVIALGINLTMILYMYYGPLGSCMALPDACGG